MSWFNYKTWLSMKYLPKSNIAKNSNKPTQQNESQITTPKLNSSNVLQLYSIFYQNLLQQSLHSQTNAIGSQKDHSFEMEPGERPVYENLIMLADAAESIDFEK